MFRAESVMSVDRPHVRMGVVRPGLRSVSIGRTVHGPPRWLKRLGSIAGVILVVWSVPLLVLALPLALAWRAVLERSRWR